MRLKIVHSNATGLSSAHLRTVWIGTYTNRVHGVLGPTGSSGIYRAGWNSAIGEFQNLQLAVRTSNPSFLAMHPSGRYLYAVNEDQSPSGSDQITAFRINPAESAESLTTIGVVSSQGLLPCHLSVDVTGRWLFVANYWSGTIAVYPIRDDGTLAVAQQTIQHVGTGSVRGRQDSAHAHAVSQSPDGRFLLSADLGANQLFVYRFDSTSGSLTVNDVSSGDYPEGSGPRHLVFSADAQWVYVLCELDPLIVTLKWNSERGSLSTAATSATLPILTDSSRSGGEIALHPNGRFLYASNRGDSNIIAQFRLGVSSIPEPIGHVACGGRKPRFFAVDPSGDFLVSANEESGDLVVFRIHTDTGALTRHGDSLPIPSPSHLVFSV